MFIKKHRCLLIIFIVCISAQTIFDQAHKITCILTDTMCNFFKYIQERFILVSPYLNDAIFLFNIKTTKYYYFVLYDDYYSCQYLT